VAWVRALREGEAGSPVAVVSLPARGRPLQAATRRVGLESSWRNFSLRWSGWVPSVAGLTRRLTGLVPW